MKSRAKLAFVLLVAIAGCHSPTGADEFIPHGTWGGDHVLLTIDATSALIEFDCAHGTLSVPIALDAGMFDITGIFVLEHGGPIRVDEEVVQRPARYTGSVTHRTMTLRVRLVDGLQDVGTYSLTLGATGRLFKCL